MGLMISIFIIVLLVLICGDIIKKKPWIFLILIGVICLGILGIELGGSKKSILIWMKQNRVYYHIFNAFKRGIFPTGMFIVVMYSSLLRDKTEIKRKFMRVRKELAIGASLLLGIHGVIYILRVIDYLIYVLAKDMSVISLYFITSLLGTVIFLIMIPLLITSFKYFRSRMKAKSWKKLHKLSYVFYAGIYVHLLVYLIKGKTMDITKLIIYTVVFGLYFILRTRKQLLGVQKS